jgi:hypothetical protein
MYRRHVHVLSSCPHMPREGLTPLPHTGWLQERSAIPRMWWVVGGMLGMSVGMVGLCELATAHLVSQALAGIGFLVWSGTVVVGIGALALLGVEQCDRKTHQYCPECLSVMARGATCCPACRFRPRHEGAPLQRLREARTGRPHAVLQTD